MATCFGLVFLSLCTIIGGDYIDNGNNISIGKYTANTTVHQTTAGGKDLPAAKCQCTGNHGYYAAQTRRLPNGNMRQSYEYNKDFGNYCYPWSKTSAFLKGMAWTDEPMCYIPCDPKKCPGVPRHKTNFLWAAEADGVNLCYSYEKCGGVDKETPYVMGCEAKGGYLLNGQCSCDIDGVECQAPTAPPHSYNPHGCKCTGNKGFYKASERQLPDGRFLAGYEFNKDYGNYCRAWSKTSSFFDGKPWSNESFCYIPCDPRECPGVPRQKTKFLWAANQAGDDLCYSYEACGGVDLETPYVEDCNRRGGYILNGKCSCELQHVHCAGSADTLTTTSKPSSRSAIKGCQCTGNQGFSYAANEKLSDGTIKKGYDYPTELGEYCSPWWGKVYSTQKDEKWFNQDFCFISCDPAVCPGVPRHETTMLWRARADEVKLCYSHEACGSVDYMTGYMESCKARGGSIVAGECSCDLRHPPQSCTVTVSDRPDREIFYATDVAAAAGVGAVIVLAIAVVLVYCMCKKMRANMRSELRAAEKSMFEVGKQAGTNINLQMTPSMRTGLLRALSEPDSPSKAILSALPPYHGSLERSFLTSNYREIYDRRANVLQLQHELLSAVHRTVTLYAGRLNPKLSASELEDMIADYMLKLQGEAFKQIVSTVPATAEYLWTSGKKHGAVHGMEFCSVLNAIIRADLPDELEAATPIFRAINVRRIVRGAGTSAHEQSFPGGGQLWRGGGFCNDHIPVFEGLLNKKYRVPGFLAASSQKKLASDFVFRADASKPRALWCINLDPRGETDAEYRVQHMTCVTKTLVEGEDEFLFAPYSTFLLVSLSWSSEIKKPHELTLQAAIDNKFEREDLPLAPWY